MATVKINPVAKHQQKKEAKMKIKHIIQTIVLLMVAVTLSVGYVSEPLIESAKQQQTGTLIGVEQIGTTPDDEGRYEYIVTMNINGLTTYFRIWMKHGEAAELRGVIGQVITIYYHWDGEGHRIYDGFKYGIFDHDE